MELNFNTINSISAINILPQNQVGIYMCMSGDAKLLINDSLFHFKRGVISVKSPIVNIQVISLSSDCEFIFIGDEVEYIIEQGRKFLDLILNLWKNNNLVFQANDDFIKFIIHRKNHILKTREILADSTNENAHRIYRVSITLLVQQTILEVLSLAYNQQQVAPIAMQREFSVLGQFLFMLHKNIATHRNVSYYADKLGISEGHFNRLLKKASGKSPSEWIIFMTINLAKNHLSNTKKSIKEIAIDLNFPEQFTFRKYFKKYVGISPKEFRKALNNL